MSITHYQCSGNISPVDQSVWSNSVGPIDHIVAGSISGTTLYEAKGTSVAAELIHKVRPSKKVYVLSPDFRCVPFSKKNTQMERYVTPYSAYGCVATNPNGIELVFSPADALSVEMTEHCDGCICGLYLSNTRDPIVKKTHPTPCCDGVLISPDSPLLQRDTSTLASMGVVKGLLKHTGGSYIHNYTMFVPELDNPIKAYSKVFR
jgi:hypothetical protein